MTALVQAEQRLATFTVGGPSIVDELGPLVRDLLGVERAIVYGLDEADDDRWQVSFFRAAHPVSEATKALFASYIAGHPGRWGLFDPSAPEPGQQNRVHLSAAAELVAPLCRDVYPALDIGARMQARALVCEGGRLLAYVGAWQPEPFRREQTEAFRRLVPAVERRLVLERRLASVSRPSVLEAALDAIPRAAFVLDERGRIREANALGRQALAADPALRAHVRAACNGAPGATVTRIEPGGGRVEHLVVLAADDTLRLAACVEAATLRWRLSRRESEVLGRLAEGRTNESGALALGISTRTFEAHVAALFRKCSASSRSELLAKALSLV